MRYSLSILAMGIATLGLSSSGCEKKPTDPTVMVRKNDPRLTAAAEEARRRWPEFAKAFEQPRSGQSFYVKSSFREVRGDKVEHMWIEVERIDGSDVAGTIGNDPAVNIGYKFGEAVRLKVDDIEDWLITEGEKKIGGFSVPILEAIEKENGGK